jgi:hypothetical protein
MPRSTRRWLILAVIVVVAVAWAATAGEEHTALVRSFLRHLTRAL